MLLLGLLAPAPAAPLADHNDAVKGKQKEKGKTGGKDKEKEKEKGDKGSQAGRPALSLLGQGQEAAGGLREPSGIAFHPRLKHLFVVGDQGSLVELDGAGKVVNTQAIPGNLEDVTVGPGGSLLLLVENSAELIAYDPGARKETGRFRLDTAGLLGEPQKDAAHGFEGVFFREDPGQPGGGILYLVHQRGPAMLVAVAADLSHPPGTIAASAVKSRFKLEHQDTTAVSYVPSLDRLLVVSDADDRIMVVGVDGKVQAEVALPGVQQEGLCFDGQGTLWIADDRAGRVVRYPGALAAFTIGLKQGRAAASTGSPR